LSSLLEERERKLISGCFLDDDVPQDKYWLTKYFTSKIQIRFLVYYLNFGSHYHFVRHTGIHCTVRYLKQMRKKLSLLENAHKEAKFNFDLDKLSKIEMGEYET